MRLCSLQADDAVLSSSWGWGWDCVRCRLMMQSEFIMRMRMRLCSLQADDAVWVHHEDEDEIVFAAGWWCSLSSSWGWGWDGVRCRLMMQSEFIMRMRMRLCLLQADDAVWVHHEDEDEIVFAAGWWRSLEFIMRMRMRLCSLQADDAVLSSSWGWGWDCVRCRLMMQSEFIMRMRMRLCSLQADDAVRVHRGAPVWHRLLQPVPPVGGWREARPRHVHDPLAREERLHQASHPDRGVEVQPRLTTPHVPCTPHLAHGSAGGNITQISKRRRVYNYCEWCITHKNYLHLLIRCLNRLGQWKLIPPSRLQKNNLNMLSIKSLSYFVTL